MDQDQTRNVSNLDLVEPNRIRDSIYACIRLLFAFWRWNVAWYMHVPFDDIRYSPSAGSNVNYFLFCVYCEVWFIWKKYNRANATHGPSPVQKNVVKTELKQCWTVQWGPGPGPGPVLTLLSVNKLADICDKAAVEEDRGCGFNTWQYLDFHVTTLGQLFTHLPLSPTNTV